MRKLGMAFSSGEVSDLIDERSALDATKRGCKTLTNAELGRYGHLDKRPGTDYLGTLKSGTDWRLEGFEFSSFTQFVIEVGSGYFRFWSNDAQVEVTTSAWVTATAYVLGDAVTESGTSYYCVEAHTSGTFATDLAAEKWEALEDDILEISTPYTGSAIHEIQFQPIQDFIYITHPDSEPKVLKRYSDTNWQIEDPGFEGPYEEVDEDIVLNCSAATGTISLTTTEDYFVAGHVGVKIRPFYQQEATTVTGDIATEFGAASAVNLVSGSYSVGDKVRFLDGSDYYFYTCIAAYSIAAWADSTAYVVDDMVSYGGTAYVCTQAHTSVLANDRPSTGTNWTDYWDAVADPSDIPQYFEAGVEMIPSTYLAGNWDFTTQGGTWIGLFRVQTGPDEVEWNTVSSMFSDTVGENFTTGADEATPIYVRVLLIYSSTTGSSDTHNLTLQQEDIPGVATITVVTDGQNATATVDTDLYSSGDAEKWEIEAWNPVDGYPRAVGFEDNRLTIAGSTTYPIDKWYSETGGYTNFIAGTLATSPFKVSAIGLDASPIQWLSNQDGAFVGTASAEGSFNPRNGEQSVSAENLPNVNWFGAEGSFYLRPIFLNSALFALQSSGRRLNEFSYSIERGFNGGYDPSEATLLAEHIMEGGCFFLAKRRFPEKGVWCILSNGDIVVFTHRPKAKMAGWWRLSTEGDVKGMAITRGNNAEDNTYLAVLRGGVGYMEKLRTGNMTLRRESETALLAGDVTTALDKVSQLGYLDCASTHTGTDLTEVTGLTRFASTEVSYLRDGVARTATVSAGGTLTLDEAGDRILVGLPFTTTIEPRSLEFFSEFGSSMSRKKHLKEAVLSYYLSVGGTVKDVSGTGSENIRQVQLADDNPTGGSLLALQTNQARVTLTGNAERKKRIRITHSDPYPFTLLGIHAEIDEHDL